MWLGLGIFVGVMLLGLIGLSLASRRVPELGLVDGRLRACERPGVCTCSEAGGDALSLPIADDDPQAAFAQARALLEAMGGRLERQTDDYAWFTFRTALFRFIDDVELRLDRDADCIRLRSASRVGGSDLGVNRRRLAELHRRWAAR